MASANPETLRVHVWRGGTDGQLREYLVSRSAHQTVLDVVTEIQRRQDPTLAYRFACRVGMCGSCAMTVNGAARWTCRTRVERAVGAAGILELRPLANFPVIRDLVCDMAGFFGKWTRAHGYFSPSSTRTEDFARITPQERAAADAGIECIGCGVCYASCDVLRRCPDYLGPAALNRAWTLLNDARDSAHARRLRAVSAEDGCHRCHTHLGCTERCPKGIAPTAAIAGLKRATARAVLAGGP